CGRRSNRVALLHPRPGCSWCDAVRERSALPPAGSRSPTKADNNHEIRRRQRSGTSYEATETPPRVRSAPSPPFGCPHACSQFPPPGRYPTRLRSLAAFSSARHSTASQPVDESFSLWEKVARSARQMRVYWGSILSALIQGANEWSYRAPLQ